MMAHVCDTGHFDRTICPEPCGRMHSFCTTCGERQDSCDHDRPAVSMTADRDAVAAVLERVLRENGLSDEPAKYDSSIHSWRCWHPDIYGPCGCFAELVSDLTDVLAAVERRAEVRALREAAERLDTWAAARDRNADWRDGVEEAADTLRAAAKEAGR